MFKKVLVVNRGEIALRVFRSCRDLGIRTAAVFSEPDRAARYHAFADEAHAIGGATPAESYLQGDRLVALAKKIGADAVHPGYGFLSENWKFAAACEKAGLRFIGPDARSMARIGNKLRARLLTKKVGVPVVPGTEGPAKTSDARRMARAHGYPILLKAASGGGGRGMRVVRHERELESAFREAAAEARGAFGDGTIFVEKFVERPRHVEFQILGDGRGNVVHLHERECSVQRRHQKLLEESPCPALTPALRREMGEAACRLAGEVKYRNAGTVEFLLAPDGRFYFMEVNARLQVEHPVTEARTGIDLVREQLRIASGEALPETVEPRGHAIECRVVAEDPLEGFVPAIGRIGDVRLPAGPGVRVDTAISPGLVVSPYYDSLLAKLICWGEDRAQAIARTLRALGEFRVDGLPTSIPFFADLLRRPEFVDARIHVKWVDEHWKPPPPVEEDVERAIALAAATEFTRALRTAPRGERLSSWQTSILENGR